MHFQLFSDLQAVLGIELDSDAFAAYKANFPHAVPHGMWQQSLAQVRGRGTR